MPDKTMTAIPRKYIAGAINTESGKNVEVIIPIITDLAVHGMKVLSIIVIRRSASFSIVRAAIIAGTPQPVPIRMGMKDLPDKPNLRKILSMMKATLAIYPESSNKDKKKKI